MTINQIFEYTLNIEKKKTPWLGYIALLIILIIVSIAAFVLSSLEGFMTGVIAVFLGLLLSFFRDDIKRILGIEEEKEESPTVSIEGEKHIQKLDKKIAKERTSLAKLLSESKEPLSSKKQRKLDQEIMEEASGLIALIDQAKSHAIQLGASDLVQHYNEIILEIEEIRTEASTRLSE